MFKFGHLGHSVIWDFGHLRLHPGLHNQRRKNHNAIDQFEHLTENIVKEDVDKIFIGAMRDTLYCDLADPH